MNYIISISTFVAAMFFSLILPNTGFGQNPGAAERQLDDSTMIPGNAASSYDLLRNLHAVNAAAITMGETALARSNRESIRSFANMLIPSHEALSRHVERIANLEKVDLNKRSTTTLGTELSRFVDETTARINNADKARFDDVFLSEFVLLATQAIKMTESVSGQLQLVQVRQLSSNALSTLRDQKTRAEQLSTQILGH